MREVEKSLSNIDVPPVTSHQAPAGKIRVPDQDYRSCWSVLSLLSHWLSTITLSPSTASHFKTTIKLKSMEKLLGEEHQRNMPSNVPCRSLLCWLAGWLLGTQIIKIFQTKIWNEILQAGNTTYTVCWLVCLLCL